MFSMKTPGGYVFWSDLPILLLFFYVYNFTWMRSMRTMGKIEVEELEDEDKVDDDDEN